MATLDIRIHLGDMESMEQAASLLNCYLNANRVCECKAKYPPPVEDAAIPVPPVEDAAIPVPPVEDAAIPVPPVEDAAIPVPPVEDAVTPAPPVEDAVTPAPPVEDAVTPAPPVEEERDSAGVLWDETLHSAAKTTLKDGTWRMKKGVKKTEDKPVPPPPGGNPGMAEEEVSYKTMMDVLKGEGLSLPQMNDLAKKVGVDSIGLVINHPELIPAIIAQAQG